jgi:hypothetical protein
LAGFGGAPQRLGSDWLQLFVIEPDRGPDCAIASQSELLAGESASALSLVDINGDGQIEIVSVQSMSPSGQTPYVLARGRDEAFAFLQPQGGQFDGLEGYCYSIDAQSGNGGQLWAAEGITTVWEAKPTYYFDEPGGRN